MQNRIIPFFTLAAHKGITIALCTLLMIFVTSLLVACSTTTPTPMLTPKPQSSPTPTAESAPAPTPNPDPKPSGPIKAVWIEPEVNGDTVSILISEIENNQNIHFTLGVQDGDMNFMAYVLDSEIYVRANVCPPCRSIGFSLDKDILICDRCATTFEAKTGIGIKGACVNYPKAAVSFELADGYIVMKEAKLLAAYQDTLQKSN